MLDYITNVSSESDFIYEDNRIRVLGVIDDISLMVKNNDVEIKGQETNNPRVGILFLLSLEKFFKGEADKEDRVITTINGKEIFSHKKIESLQKEMF